MKSILFAAMAGLGLLAVADSAISQKASNGKNVESGKAASDGTASFQRLLLADGSVAVDFSGTASPTHDPQLYFGRGLYIDAQMTTDCLAMRRDGEQWRLGPSTGPGERGLFGFYSDTYGQRVMTMSNSGKVGIGVEGAPTQALQVNGIVRGMGGNYGAGELNLDDGTEEFYGNSFQIRFERRSGDAHRFYSLKGVTPGNSLALFVDNKFDNGLFIESGGEVGVGTFHPEAKLDVRGNLRVVKGTGGLFVEPYEDAVKLLTTNRVSLLYLNPKGGFEFQHEERWASFYCTPTGRLGSNFLGCDLYRDSVDLAARQLVGADGSSVKVDWHADSVEINSDLKVAGKISMSRQGDILMGEFGRPE